MEVGRNRGRVCGVMVIIYDGAGVVMFGRVNIGGVIVVEDKAVGESLL